jgi:hypothetical protein
MACYRCGVRQVDPVRGHSPWQRGVRGNQQVLICPTCQGIHDWKTDLDQCGRCGSVRLVRRLGEAECRDCGYVATSEPVAVPEMAGASEMAGAPEMAGIPEMAGMPDAPGLSEEVARALERVLGHGPGRG